MQQAAASARPGLLVEEAAQRTAAVPTVFFRWRCAGRVCGLMGQRAPSSLREVLLLQVLLPKVLLLGVVPEPQDEQELVVELEGQLASQSRSCNTADHF